jgi:hypothetical protein
MGRYSANCGSCKPLGATMQKITCLFDMKEIGVRKHHFILAEIEVPPEWNEWDDGERHHYMTMPNEKYGYSQPIHGGINPAPTPIEHFITTPMCCCGEGVFEVFDFTMVTRPTKQAVDKSKRRLFTNLIACGSCH